MPNLQNFSQQSKINNPPYNAAMSLTLAILAGGRSSRMGTDKAWVPVRGRPLIAHILEQLRPACAETLIITNRPEAYLALELPLFGDVWPDVGALGGAGP